MTLRLHAPGIDLALTLESGQFFRARALGGGWWRIPTHGRCLEASQDGDTLVVEGAEANFARAFFALDEEPAGPPRDPRVRPALDAARGLRILRQEPWECIAAFITSQVSNIPRISRNVEDMAEAFGRALGPGLPRAFPRPEELGTEADLRALGLGFRARYLVAAAAWAREVGTERVAGLATDELLGALQRIPGIAAKVADCIALFAYGRREVFPVDTWIRQAVTALAGRMTDARARQWGRERFGANAGFVQQALFVWARNGGISAPDDGPNGSGSSGAPPPRTSPRPRSRLRPGAR